MQCRVVSYECGVVWTFHDIPNCNIIDYRRSLSLPISLELFLTFFWALPIIPIGPLGVTRPPYC